MTTLSRWHCKRLVRNRLCFVWGQHVPDGAGVYHPDLCILAHRPECSARIDAIRRVYDRSRHGRFRPVREVLELLEEARQCT